VPRSTLTKHDRDGRELDETDLAPPNNVGDVEFTDSADAPTAPQPGAVLPPPDLCRIDDHGRLRLLGRAGERADRRAVAHDTRDALGTLLGRYWAPTHPDQAVIRLLSSLTVLKR
jgi:hypothetical protein